MNGPQLGTVVAMSISGVLSSSIGWPSIFYVFGAVGVAWSLAFFFLGSDRPSDHPKICPTEARYINDSLGNLDKTGDSKVSIHKLKIKSRYYVFLLTFGIIISSILNEKVIIKF